MTTTSIAIMKVLSSYPEGRASFASLKADMAVLASPEWQARMRALGQRAGPINLFSHDLATRDADGWAITEAGRALLARIESGETLSLAQPPARPELRVVVSNAPRNPDASKPTPLKVVA